MDSSCGDPIEKDPGLDPVTQVGDMARQGAIGMEDLIRNKIGKIRHWKLTSLGKKRPRWGLEFKVMTYNILSQTAAESHIYLYMKCNPQFLSEEYRISKILPEILKSNSDVVCLQEVEQYLFDQRIRSVFESNGFGSVFKKRTGNKGDGCAILWRRAKFNLLRHHEVEFRSKGCEFLNRDNVGLIAVLKPRHPEASKTQLHVATTHLIFNPRRGDVKLCQLRLLLAELERSAFKSAGANGRLYHPTIICGDFNFEPRSPLYQFLENGRLDLSGLVSGDMSGQHEGKDKGGKLFMDRMSMDSIGIDECGRFRQDSEIRSRLGKKTPKGVDRNSAAGVSKKGSNGSQQDSYRLLTAAHLQSKTDCAEVHPTVNNARNEFLKDASPSSSSSSESDAGSKLIYHDFNFVPAYKYYHKDGKGCPVTSMTGRDCNTVDHIFYNVKSKCSTSFTEDRLKLLGVYTLPLADDLRDFGGPNAHLGSDHLSLMAKFLIKP